MQSRREASDDETVLEQIRRVVKESPTSAALLCLRHNAPITDAGRLGCRDVEGRSSPEGPDGIAETWTFREVWDCARAAAALLRRSIPDRRHKDESRPFMIGLALPEGPTLPLLELAVLLAHCAIVPLDPSDPPARVAYVLQCTEMSAAVVQNAAGKAVIESAVAQQSRPQGDPEAVLISPSVHLAADLVGRTLAHDSGPDVLNATPIAEAISHVFFTSGSTGRPKGCIATHRTLASYCAARNSTYSVDARSTCFVASAHTFDPSLGDLLATWCVGGRVAYAPRTETFSCFGSLLSASETTHLCCTPSLFATLPVSLAAGDTALSKLRVVALGGEPTPPLLVSCWAGGSRQLYNTYGVTECTVYNTARLRSTDDHSSFITPALPGNGLSVVNVKEVGDNEQLDPDCPEDVADGEVGELVIYGQQVGKGYLQLPQLTAKVFRFHSSRGRCYLTGDLARVEVGSGDISLLGRRDNQVKVRGFRIELSEVDYWVSTAADTLLTAVASSLVAGRLFVFCVPAHGIAGHRAEHALRATLLWLCAKSVPSAMRPQHYFFVPELPLTSSGKVARGRLQDLLPCDCVDAEGNLNADRLGILDEGSDQHLCNPLEVAVANAWSSELAVPADSLRRSSDFFELGGHSITALRACRNLVRNLRGRKQRVKWLVEGDENNEDAGGLEAALGGDLGELVGPFAVQELLQRSRLSEYAAFLATKVANPAVTDDSSENIEGTAPSSREIDAKPHALPLLTVENSTVDAVSLLHQAAAAGVTPIVDFLVEHGHAAVDGHCSMKRLKVATRAQRSLRQVDKGQLRPIAPLHSAAAGGSVEAMRSLIRLRAAITATEAHGVMALHLAASKGPAEAVELLLQAGAPLTAKDTNLQTVLHYAARSGNPDTTARLLEAWLADERLVATSVRTYGGALEWRDRWHRTPVHWAVLNGHITVLRALIEAKASAEPAKISDYKHSKNTSLRHESPLEIAQRRGFDEAEKFLMARTLCPSNEHSEPELLAEQ